MPATAPSTRTKAMGLATPVWIVVVIVVAAAVGGLGFYAGYEYRGSPAVTGVTANNTLSILGAGTLTDTFPQLASEFVNETPGVTSPIAAQNYEGSLDITSAITSLAATADVAAVADYRLIPQLLEPQFASWEIVFATTQEVLIYNSSLPAFHGVNASNWGQDLIQDVSTPGNAPFGYWNASTDPNGYNEIFSMMLQGMMYDGGNTSAIYSHFYTGAPGAYAVANPKTTIFEHESHAALDVESGVVSAVITYKAVAIQNDLPYVLLDPIVGLMADNSTALADYKMLSTQIYSSALTLESVVPAPILFSVTVPSNAQNLALGAEFIHLLLSPQGSAILSEENAWTPIFPGWSPTPSAVPSLLAPDVAPLPAWAATILG
ncbi:MAG: extracellular solute-binding protein [Thermoplasmata archaeon]|nr:extracellular solute-binding protein [Thermoplasmata archaeon]